MAKKAQRIHRTRTQTPEQEAAELALRQRLLQEKPSLQDLVERGDIIVVKRGYDSVNRFVDRFFFRAALANLGHPWLSIATGKQRDEKKQQNGRASHTWKFHMLTG